MCLAAAVLRGSCMMRPCWIAACFPIEEHALVSRGRDNTTLSSCRMEAFLTMRCTQLSHVLTGHTHQPRSQGQNSTIRLKMAKQVALSMSRALGVLIFSMLFLCSFVRHKNGVESCLVLVGQVDHLQLWVAVSFGSDAKRRRST